MNHSIATSLLAFLAFAAPGFANAQPEAKILRTKGAVQVDGKIVHQGGTIKPGPSITTGEGSAALLGLAPGQTLFVNKDTTLSITELKFSGSDRSSVVQLVKGAVQSNAQQPKDGTTSQKIVTPCGDLKAGAAAWRTSLGEGPMKEGSPPHGLGVSVYSGNVTYSHPRIGEVILKPGQVATMNCDPNNPLLTVVDLTTGRVYIYGPGGQVTERLADARELAAAALSFQEGIGAFLATSTDDAQLALGQLIAQINAVLGRNNVPPITTGHGPLFPNLGAPGLDHLSDVASPESANLNQ